MTRNQFLRRFVILTIIAATGQLLFADDSNAEKYLLRYKFRVGDVMKWEVSQKTHMITSMASEKEVADSNCVSTKVWTVKEVDENGTAILEYMVQDTMMHNKVTNEEEKSYNSKTDEKVSPVFREVADAIGIPLAHFTINAEGKMLKKVPKAHYSGATQENRIAIPMPQKPIAIGESWDVNDEIIIKQKNGTVKKIPISEYYTLEKVQNGIATINFRTIVLSNIINDKKLQLELIPYTPNGKIQFDIEKGHSIAHELDIDRNLLNALDGATSSNITYQSRFSEKFLFEPEVTVATK